MNGLLARFLNIRTDVEKSPKIEGAYQGTKAAIIAAPLGAAIQALRGKNPYLGAAAAGISAGALTGLVAAASQKYKNMRTEAQMGYHLENMPEFYNQPQEEYQQQIPQTIYQPADISSNFSRGFESVRNPY